MKEGHLFPKNFKSRTGELGGPRRHTSGNTKAYDSTKDKELVDLLRGRGGHGSKQCAS